MQEDGNYWFRRSSLSRLSRRRFIGTTAAGGAGLAGLALVGCGDDDDDDPVDGTPGATNTSAPGQTATTGPTTPVDDVKKGGVLRGVNLGGNVFDSVDVHRAFGDPTSWLSNYVLNKVVRYSNPDTGEIEGDLAEEFESPDAQTYTFKIRENVKWQETPLTNGRGLTAEDIKWHFERQAAGLLADGTETPFRHQTFYQTLTNIDMPDDYTLVVTLDSPNGTFIDRLAAYFSTVPNRETTEAIEADHRTLSEDSMPATGAFKLTQWRANEEIKFEANPDYFREGEPNIDGWIYPILFEDPNAYRLAFEQKQVDGWASPDPSLTLSVIEENRDTMTEYLTGVANTVFLHLNMNQQFKDVRHVQAVNLAFDRRLMIETFHQGLGQVSGPVTWLQEGYAIPPDEILDYDGYRVDRDAEIKAARDIWEQTDGASLGEINIKIPDTWLLVWPDTSQVIPAMLNEALGVDQFISTRSTYNEEIIPNLSNGTFPNWFAWTSQVSGPDPRSGLSQTFHSASTANFQHVNNPDLDALLEAALLETDFEAGVATTREAQDIMMANGQYGNIVVYNYISRSTRWNYWKGGVKVEGTTGSPGQGYNIFSGHLNGGAWWIDTDDPSFEGRSPITL
jgi:peptide/nickel transport system substrate-binding protein